MLVHNAFINVKKATCDFNNALVNAEINIKINNAIEVLFIFNSC